MQEKEMSLKTCKSIFKNGQLTTTRNQFTKKWMELVNKIQKNKEVL